MKTIFILVAALCLTGGHSSAAETANPVESATGRGLALVTRAAGNWQKNKTCFSCHHQTLPMLAMTEASRAGFALDKSWLQSQAGMTHTYFAERIEEMDEGDHVPGGAATAAYGLWALSLDQRPPDQTTTSIVTYLLRAGPRRRSRNSSHPSRRWPNPERISAARNDLDIAPDSRRRGFFYSPFKANDNKSMSLNFKRCEDMPYEQTR